MGRNPHEETARAGGKPGYGPAPDRGGGDAPHLRTKTTFAPKKDTTPKGDGVKTFVSNLPSVKFAKWGIKKLGNVFQPKTEQQKVQANIDRGYDVLNPAEMHRATQRKPVPVGGGPGDRDGLQNTIATQSIVSLPTADKAGGFGHQWNFQAYGTQQNVAANPYDYKQAPYAKKGKLVRKYATGQEIKNFSKGKRFGPPPEKGPNPQGLQTILENSDYFKTLIG